MKTREYRLTDSRSGESFTLKVGRQNELTVYDPNFKRPDGQKGARRAIRHCPNQKSIYVDEQDKHAIVTPIIFRFGMLEVPESEPMTIAFLDAHPANAVNGGMWFEPIDEEGEAKESIEIEELKADILTTVRKVAKSKDGLHELTAVVSVITGSIDEARKMGIEQLKREIYNKIDEDPYYFADDNGNVTIFEDDIVKRKYITLTALKEQIIKKSTNGRSILWANDSSIILTAPRSVDLIEHFAEFLATDEGILVAEEIAKRS